MQKDGIASRISHLLQAIPGADRVAASGHSAEIVVIDTNTLQIVCNLVAPWRSNWIASFTVVQSTSLVAISVEGAVYEWSVQDIARVSVAETARSPQRLAPTRTQNLEDEGCALALVASPLGLSLAVVCPKHWTVSLSNSLRRCFLYILCLVSCVHFQKLFVAATYASRTRIVCPCKSGWAGAAFLAELDVLAWTKASLFFFGLISCLRCFQGRRGLLVPDRRHKASYGAREQRASEIRFRRRL